MNPEEFAAQRRAKFVKVDDELRSEVAQALRRYMNGYARWEEDLITAASVIWLENFAAEAPNADPERFMDLFHKELAKALAHTDQPMGMIEQSQVDRLTRWLGTYVVNMSTWQGSGARGTRQKRWTSMHDTKVRDSHALADGQVRPIAAPFNVDGVELRFPGDPVGPAEVWMNCRCIMQPAEQRGTANVSATTFTIADEDTQPLEVNDEGVPVDELDEDEEEVTEIPVHGVLAPEGVPTGDGRQFAEGALTHRELPLPIAYQIMSAEGHLNSVTVGRIDEIERVGNVMRFRGALMVGRERSAEVVEGILDGTVRGVSVDVDNVTLGEMAEGMDPDFVEFADARIAGVTIVPIPAFQEAFIALGHEFLDDLPDEAKEALAACGCAEGPEDSVEDENPDIELAYDAFRVYDADARKRMAKAGTALPDGSFPIADLEDLKNAIQAIGRASDPAAAKAHIKKRARALGHTDLIPEGWGADVIDLSEMSPDEFEAYNAMTQDEQNAYIDEHLDMIIASGSFAEVLQDPTQFAPGTKDGPGWITHPIPTNRIRRYWTHGKGAAKIRWGAPGDFNRCRRQLAKYVQNPEWLAGTCANMHKEALGFWPSTHRRLVRGHAIVASATPAPIFTIVASSHYVFDHNMFERQNLDDPRVGVILDGDHVYGYMAQWGVCHIGISGICTEAPSSNTDYWYYATGVLDTDRGEVRVGQITMDTGHASLKASHRVAAAHYDNTGAAVADVAVGEDEFGIWFSGVMRPSATEAQRHALRASGRISGDWRTIGGSLEMVAGLVVNVPGLPIPHALAASANGVQTALIAAGIVMPDQTGPYVPEVVHLSAEQIASIVRVSVTEYRHAEKRAEKSAPIRDALRQKRIESLRQKIKE